MLYFLLALFRIDRQRDWSSFSDKELVDYFKKTSNNFAFAELYSRYDHIALGVCMKYLKDPVRAEDAAMDVFEKLLKDLKHQEIDSFGPWLYTVCKNHCLMQIRLSKSMSNRYQKYELFYQQFMENEGDLHLNNEQSNEMLLEAMELALNKLSKEQKQCLNLFYLEQKSYKEIEIITGYSDKKVKSYIQNGKRNLKIELTGKA